MAREMQQMMSSARCRSSSDAPFTIRIRGCSIADAWDPSCIVGSMACSDDMMSILTETGASESPLAPRIWKMEGSRRVERALQHRTRGHTAS